MELFKFLFVLLVAAVVLTEAKPTRQRIRQQHQVHCSKVRGRPCVEDIECACLNHHNSTLICNYEHKCERPSIIDEIIRSQPCPGIFKSYCTKDADCPCNERRLICEDHECVKDRPRNKQV